MNKLIIALVAIFAFGCSAADEPKHVPLVQAIAVKSCGALIGFIFSRADGQLILMSNDEESRELNSLMIESVPREQRKVLTIVPPGGCQLTT